MRDNPALSIDKKGVFAAHVPAISGAPPNPRKRIAGPLPMPTPVGAA